MWYGMVWYWYHTKTATNEKPSKTGWLLIHIYYVYEGFRCVRVFQYVHSFPTIHTYVHADNNVCLLETASGHFTIEGLLNPNMCNCKLAGRNSRNVKNWKRRRITVNPNTIFLESTATGFPPHHVRGSIMRMELRFDAKDHGWSKIVGIHRYNEVAEQEIIPGMLVDLVWNPNNRFHWEAIEVRTSPDRRLIGHLRHQVSDVLEVVNAEGWAMEAYVTSNVYTSTDNGGPDGFRRFREANLRILISGEVDRDNQGWDNVMFQLDTLYNRPDDFPYDMAGLW